MNNIKASYITETSDFHDAIWMSLNPYDLAFCELDVLGVTVVSDNSSIVVTNYGDYFCESFETKDGRIFTRVMGVITR